jgi:hypothetical protein
MSRAQCNESHIKPHINYQHSRLSAFRRPSLQIRPPPLPQIRPPPLPQIRPPPEPHPLSLLCYLWPPAPCDTHGTLHQAVITLCSLSL